LKQRNNVNKVIYCVIESTGRFLAPSKPDVTEEGANVIGFNSIKFLNQILNSRELNQAVKLQYFTGKRFLKSASRNE
jgi:hypothetical protein